MAEQIEAVSNFCISCLNTNDLYNLFDLHKFADNGDGNPFKCVDIIKECFNIEITPELGLEDICGQCLLTLKNAHQFRADVLKNIKELENTFQNVEYLEDDGTPTPDPLRLEEEVLKTNIKVEKFEIDDGYDTQEIDLNSVISRMAVERESSLPIKEEEIKTELIEENTDLKKKVRFNEVIEHSDDVLRTAELDIQPTVKQEVIEKEIQTERKTILKKVSKYSPEIETKSNLRMMSDVAFSYDSSNEDNGKSIPKLQKIKPKPFTIKSDKYKCTKCAFVLPSSRSYYEHLREQHAVYLCLQCGRKFNDERSMARHADVHVPGPHTCNICNKTFKKLNTLKSHEWRAHKTTEPFGCRECGLRFKTFHTRLNHMKNDHGMTEPQYPCPHCDKKYFYSGTRATHIRLTHMKQRKYKCTECPMAFGRKPELSSHKATVHNIGEKRFQCPMCLKTYFRSTTLRYHLKTHLTDGSEKSKRYRCETCDAGFNSRVVYFCHLKMHERDSIQTEIVDDPIMLVEDSNL